MRVYPAADEQKLHEIERSRDWLRSGLITREQAAGVEAGAGEPLTEAGWAIRAAAFFFTSVAQFGLIFYFGIGLRGGAEEWGLLLLMTAPVCWIGAEIAAGRYRLYRFGVEEALVVGAVWQAVAGIFLVAGREVRHAEAALTFLVGLPLLSLSSVAYLRFGFPYAPFAALIGLGIAVFGLDAAPRTERLLLAGLYLSFCAAAFRIRVPEFEEGRWSVARAGAYLGAYLVLNLKLESLAMGAPLHLMWRARVAWEGSSVYWFTFACMWLLPAAALAVGARRRDRALLDAGIVTAALTLMTWKPYVGLERNVWDAATFGVFLIAASLLIRRWLEAGPDRRRDGFTADPVFTPRDQGVPAASLAAAAMATAAPSAPESREGPGFKGGGGASGGAGAGGTY